MGNTVTMDSSCKPLGTTGLSKGLPDVSKETIRGHVPDQKFEYAVSGMKGFRETMEDQHLVCTDVQVNGQTLEGHSLFVVFDGHGGSAASQFCASNFLQTFTNSEDLEKYARLQQKGRSSRADTNGIKLIKRALIYTFEELDRQLTVDQVRKNKEFFEQQAKLQQQGPSSEGKKVAVPVGERSGTTCIAVLFTPSHFVCANAGDSRAILKRNGKVLPLSFDHTPSTIPEKIRVIQAKGEVVGKRIDGDLAVSRALGDFVHKLNPDVSPAEQKVIATPDFTIYPRVHSADEFIVLACDGIWDVATNQECSDYVQSLLSSGETDLGNICEDSIDTCLERNSRDNMTIAIIGLPAMKVDRSGRSAMMNIAWSQRSMRTARRFAQHSVVHASVYASNTLRSFVW